MPDLMSRAMTWLSRKQRQFLSRSVLYEHYDDEGVILWQRMIPAVLGHADALGEASVEPVRIDANEIDFLIAADDLRMESDPIEPGANDRVYLIAAGRTCRYEVMSRGGALWRWSDPQQTIRRVFAKLTDDYPEAGGPP